VPVAAPDGDAAEIGKGSADVDVDVEALDVHDAPRTGAETQAAPEQAAALSPLAQVMSLHHPDWRFWETECLSL
jgi:hypothetical protein